MNKTVNKLKEAKRIFFETDNGVVLLGDLLITSHIESYYTEGVRFGINARIENLREFKKPVKRKKK